MKIIDAVSLWCGRLVAWLFVAVAGMITYEVVSRYVFNAPTIWAVELSLFCQIWVTYLGAAYVVQQRALIRIDILAHILGSRFAIFSDLLSISIIVIFSGFACYYGTEVVLESIRLGRSQPSMLSLPLWVTEIAIPLGFGLLIVQCLVEGVRIITQGSSKNGMTHV